MTTLDTIIQSFQTTLTDKPYTRTVYGRAMVFQETWGDDKSVQVPKVFIGDTEYKIPLPDDNDAPIVFFQAVGAEQYDEFDRDNLGTINRQIALTWWGRVDQMSLEEVKFEVIQELQQSGYVSGFNSYVDERYEDVFPDFVPYISVKELERTSQWLMAPYSGFRLVFSVAYLQGRVEC